MVEKNGHQISDFGATAFRQRQASKPGLDLNCSDLSQFIVPPVRKDLPDQVRFVDFLRSVTAPGVLLCKFTLLEMIAKLRDRNRAGANPDLSRIKLCQQQGHRATAGHTYTGLYRAYPSRSCTAIVPSGLPVLTSGNSGEAVKSGPHLEGSWTPSSLSGWKDTCEFP